MPNTTPSKLAMRRVNTPCQLTVSLEMYQNIEWITTTDKILQHSTVRKTIVQKNGSRVGGTTTATRSISMVATVFYQVILAFIGIIIIDFDQSLLK